MTVFNVNNRVAYYEYNYPCSDTSSCHDVSVYLDPGIYVFEVFGASGGDGYRQGIDKTTIGGRGGYARGCISITKRTRVYMFIGGQGRTNNEGEDFALGGFNGGGKGTVGQDNRPTGSGGGATDVRIGCKSLKCRKIIAGGGGGAGSPNGGSTADVGFGGSGGGSEGLDGKGHSSLSDNYRGTGGTQSGPGIGGSAGGVKVNDGELGKGGFYHISRFFDSSGGGGGGGYYGGGGSGAAGGAGGSGYLDQSLLKLNDITSILIDGDTPMTDLYGNSYIGNKGNGFIHVTVLSRKFVAFSQCLRRINTFSFLSTLVNIILIK